APRNDEVAAGFRSTFQGSRGSCRPPLSAWRGADFHLRRVAEAIPGSGRRIAGDEEGGARSGSTTCRDVQSWVAEAQQKLAAQVKLPDGYYFEFGGQFKNLQAARARLMILVPMVLAIIFVLIFAAFGSLRQALVIYSGIPLAVTGGVFALVLRGLPFSISAGVGFIALSGVAVLNGVVLITYFNQLREEGKGMLDSVLEGSLTRLRPVLMTALVASL